MSEVPVWVNGCCLMVTGVTRKTSCGEVIQVLLDNADDVHDYCIMERWKKVERPLDSKSKILKVWSQWGDEKKEIKFTLKKTENEADSGRGSPAAAYTTSLRRRKNRSKTSGKPPWNRHETLHPKRLAELGEYGQYLRREDAESKENKPCTEDAYGRLDSLIMGKEKDVQELMYSSVQGRKKMKCKNQHGCTGTGVLHSTLLPEVAEATSRSKCCKKKLTKQKVRNSENIEKLMKLILAQGATIQNQLHRLKEREEQIENIEIETHRERIEKNGRNYLLETYLGSLDKAELPRVSDDEEKGNDSGVHTEGGSDQMINPTWECKETKNNEDRISTEKQDLSQSRQSRRDGRDLVNDESNKQKLTRRSKSEGRTKELDNVQKETLKRTNSEKLVNSKVDDISAQNDESTKEESLELSNIKNQIDLWEKVLKINKKLEREEEILVRLHVKIRKLQIENSSRAKEVNDSIGVEESEENRSLLREQQELQGHLEKLRKELDDNSKEIYHNFTKLINSDEEVIQKQNMLKQVVNDLDLMESEGAMLTNVLRNTNKSVTETGRQVQVPQIEGNLLELGLALQLKGQEIIKRPEEQELETEDGKCSTGEVEKAEISEEPPLLDLVPAIPVITTSEEDLVIRKPKSVKITFGDEIISTESDENKVATKMKEPAPANVTAKKGILKNRNYLHDMLLNPQRAEKDLEKVAPDYSTNIKNEQDDLKVVKSEISLERVSLDPPTKLMDYLPYIHPINDDSFHNPIYGARILNQFPSVHNERSGKEELYATRRVLIHPSSCFNNSSATVVTTKAQVHNDTDSNTSSETSGLSSMNSNSPTTEERPHRPVYVLDTLV